MGTRATATAAAREMATAVAAARAMVTVTAAARAMVMASAMAKMRNHEQAFVVPSPNRKRRPVPVIAPAHRSQGLGFAETWFASFLFLKKCTLYICVEIMSSIYSPLRVVTLVVPSQFCL